ncbi:MAG: amidohydrolase, partial [Chloroflexota bacterium]
MPQRATLYFHAIIHTMDERLPLADALVIQGDRIAMIGHVHDLEDALPPGTIRIDLEGQSVVPGFNDCHAHILGFGLSLNEANVSVDAVSSIPETVDVLRRRLVSTGEHEWLIGRGYDQNMLAEHRHPNRNDLDAATSQRPIVLAHTSGHVLTCNSAALERAGITAGTPDPPGGEIERDEHGVPTGVLKETATQLVNRMIPEPSAEQGAAAIVRAMQVMAGFGITSATDAATGQGTSAEPQLEMYRSALSSGKLAGRISLVPRIEYVAPPDTGEIHAKHEFDAGDQPEWLAISGAKIFSDGAMSTRTAALRSPYADDAQNYGILLWETPVLLNMMRRAHTAGWQIVTHALGDRAVETVLDCYQQVLTGDHHGEHRHRIE